VKRAKRSLGNITRDFIQPLIQTVIWRRMQYDPVRYPADLKFRVVGTLGIVARELEQSQLQNAAAIAPQGSPLQLQLLRAYFENTSSPHKSELVAAVDQMMQPDPAAQEHEQKMRQLELAKLQAEVTTEQTKGMLQQAQTALAIAKAQAEMASIGAESNDLALEVVRLEKEFGELREFSRQNDISLIKALQPNKSASAQ
jgi:hypothetical protein